MHTAPKANVRTSLTVAILLTVVLSWVISTGIANYFNYLNFRSLHQQMIKHPDLYPCPIPEPRFGIVEFLTGRPPIPRASIRQFLDSRLPAPGESARGHLPDPPPPLEPPKAGAPSERSPMPSHAWFEIRTWLLRLVIAFALATLAGALLGRRFTRPLNQLAEGAEAFQSGNFDYRIPAKGKNEFAAVAAAMNQMAQQVSDQIKDLEKDAERRRQFLADIAHEFRSPVTTMRTMAGALQDGVAEVPERRERAVSALVGTSERLLRLVQDLMELAKLDLDELPLYIKQVDLQELIESVIQSHEAEAESAGVILHHLNDSQPLRAEVDPDRMTQVLNNIIENAISYAGRGAEVKLSLQDSDPIRMTISDTGKGIRVTDIPYVTDPFYRADAARTPGDCHSGLGLSIACRLVEAHGGKLTIDSDEGRGTTVTITIPQASQ